MTSTKGRNIFIAMRAAEDRNELYEALKRPYRSSMRIWSYPIYLFPGILIGLANALPMRLIQAFVIVSFIIANALFFEVIRLRRRCETATALLISMEEVRIHTMVTNTVPVTKA